MPTSINELILLFLFILMKPSNAQISSSSPTNILQTSTAVQPFETTSYGSMQSPNTTQTSSSSKALTVLAGTPSAIITLNGTSSVTASASARPTNSQPCNGHIDFCNRRFSNVSMVVAHNSPFVVAHNAASNQDIKVLDQLNDGIRGLQFQTHMVNNTLRLCHTSCDLLDAGTLEAYLVTVEGWLATHPYEVIAIMIGNYDKVAPTAYVQPFQDAGLLPHLYTPGTTTATLEQWPTLSEMIIKNTRVVAMLDYQANQSEVSWLLDEFSYQWETPFSPTNPAFPCTQQRPPNQAEDVSRDRMYMANHNLNIEVSLISGMDPILIPAYTLLDQVNAVSGNASLGRNVDNCTAVWGRAPNWLLVDYYNHGNFNGSVFQVAATANNVSYNRDQCCGSASANAAVAFRVGLLDKLLVVGGLVLGFLL